MVLAADRATRVIEDHAGWLIKNFARTARRYRTVQIRAGRQILTAADHCPTTHAMPSPSSLDQSLRTNLTNSGRLGLSQPFGVGCYTVLYDALSAVGAPLPHALVTDLQIDG